jgi:hypothetical protein
MQSAYVPYWVFHACTHTYWTADTSHTPPGARADWYPLSGEHHGEYADLLIGASGALTPAETVRLCPFDLTEGVPPEKVDLQQATVEQFSVPRKYARPLARSGLEQLECTTCAQRYVPGRSRNVHANVRLESLHSEPVLLPVWIMAYRYNDRVYRFLVNGQNGRATGQAPVSWLKIVMIPAIAIVFVLLLLAGLGPCSRALGADNVDPAGWHARPVPQVRRIENRPSCEPSAAEAREIADRSHPNQPFLPPTSFCYIESATDVRSPTDWCESHLTVVCVAPCLPGLNGVLDASQRPSAT